MESSEAKNFSILIKKIKKIVMMKTVDGKYEG